MTQEQKDIWIKALRSGKYKQGRGALKTGDEYTEYCCLGVANEVLNLGVHPSDFFLSGTDTDPGFRFLDKDRQWLLAQLNDIDGSSFNEIADYIEKNVPPNE